MDAPSTFEPRAVLDERRAGWTRVAAAVPALALVVMVFAGVSGSRSNGDVAAGPIDASPVPRATAYAPALRLTRPRADPGYPTTVLGLAVRTLPLLAGRPPDFDTAVAVAGWFEAGPTGDCPADERTFCERSGLLFASSPSVATGSGATYSSENRFKDTQVPGLAVTLTPGIAVPPELDDSALAATQVIFIGRIVDGELLVDRVVWAAGRGQGQTTSILPALLDVGPQLGWRTRERLAEAALGPTGGLLMETLVDQPSLAVVDPVAAAIVAINSPRAARLWYQRLLGLYPGTEDIRWIVIDDATGEVLAGGVVGP